MNSSLLSLPASKHTNVLTNNCTGAVFLLRTSHPYHFWGKISRDNNSHRSS